MRIARISPLMLGAFLLGVILIAGCGGEKPRQPVSGKVILPKVKLLETDSVSLTFTPVAEDTAMGGHADVSVSDLSFSTTLPEGQYKIAVSIQPYPGEKGSAQREGAFEQFNDKYGMTNTPLTYEVTSGAQTITVDTVKGTITKN